MASGFPGSIDNFTDPLTTSPLNSPSHAGQHQDLNDAVEKIETYMGLVKVIPTSVSSAGGTAATLAANGTVTIGTSNTSVTVNGAFSSLYDNYKIIITGGLGSQQNNMAFQLSGITTGVYNQLGYFQSSWASAARSDYASAGATSIIAADISTVAYASDIEIRGPFASRQKFGMVQAQSTNNQYSFPFYINSTTSATGFSLIPALGNITGGTIRVYGYRN